MGYKPKFDFRWTGKEDAANRIEGIKKDPSELIKQIKKEKSRGLTYVQQLNDIKNKQLLKIARKGNIVVVPLANTILRTAQALAATDEHTVNFIPDSNSFLARNKANKLNAAAAADAKSMKREIRKEILYRDALRLGLGVEIFIGYDNILKTPISLRLDPRMTVPDPGVTDFNPNSFFGYFGEVEYEKLKNDTMFFNLDILLAYANSEEEVTRNLVSHRRAVERSGVIDDKDTISVYHHYTRFRGHLYLCTLCANDSQLVRIEEITPVHSYEFADLSRIKIPVVYTRMDLENGYYGSSILDFVEAAQDEATLVQQLRRQTILRTQMGSDIIVNSEVIAPEQLQNKKIGGNIIAAKFDPTDNKTLQSYFQVVPETVPSAVGTEYTDRIRTDAERDVGFGNSLQQGVSAQGNQTAKEITRLQRNSDLLFRYVITMFGRAEAEYWYFWLRAQKQHVKENKKVYTTKNSTISYAKEAVLEAKDFENILFYTIESKEEKKARNEQEFSKLNLVLTQLAATKEPGSPELNFMLRRLLQTVNMDEDEILKYIPFTDEEDYGVFLITLSEGDVEFAEDYTEDKELELVRRGLESLRADWVLQFLRIEEVSNDRLEKYMGVIKNVVDEQKKVRAQQAEQAMVPTAPQQEDTQIASQAVQNQLGNALQQENIKNIM